MDYIDFFDDGDYRRSLVSALKSLITSTNSDAVLYILKSRIALSNFNFFNKNQVKILVFYYFYLCGKVDFSNQYTIFFLKQSLPNFSFFSLLQEDYKSLDNFVQYFNLGKNKIFLNKIQDITLSDISDSIREDAYKVDNIVDFFIVFLVENFELYSLEGEHFPLFKWIINEFHDIYT